MNSGATTERVYDRLRARIMNREFRPGDRLDAAVLAPTLSSSVTPVRDALHLLTGEGLVQTRTSGGFHMPPLDEPGLEDMYDWSAELLAISLRGWPRRVESGAAAEDASSGLSIAQRAADLFQSIGRRSDNREHGLAIERLNARMHAIRGIEATVLLQPEQEMGALAAAFMHADRDGLRRLSVAYHRRRRRAAAEIVRAMYRMD